MLFEFSDAQIAVRSDIPDAFRVEWSRLAAPGTWWSGAERVQIAAEARRAMAGERTASRPTSTAGEAEGQSFQPPLTNVVRTVAASSPLISAEWVDRLEANGLELPAYAEIIGVVSRLSAVDLFHIALGMPLQPLPSPQSGEPSRTPPPTNVVVGKSFVPMVQAVSIPQTVSLVPPETVAWQALSDVMYMTFEEMGDPDFRHALHRTQMELVAARTSQINECFY